MTPSVTTVAAIAGEVAALVTTSVRLPRSLGGPPGALVVSALPKSR